MCYMRSAYWGFEMGRTTDGTSKLHAPNDPAPGLTAQLIRTTRWFLADGGTIEEALNCVIEGARQEFLCRVLIEQPARLRIDGHSHTSGLKTAGVLIRAKTNRYD